MVKRTNRLTPGILLLLFSPALHAQEIKHIDDQWIKDLYAQHEKTVYRGDQLKTIGMPVGGIAAGQLYIRGDGTLAQWWIANNAYNTGASSPLQTPLGPVPVNYTTFTPVSFIDQGFSIKWRSAGKTIKKELSSKDFSRISFTGEYPVARIHYDDRSANLPVAITMEAFSPFIPLDSRASATPGTFLIFNIKNKTKAATRVDLSGWLQNPVCLELQKKVNGKSRNRVVKEKNIVSLVMDMLPIKGIESHPYFGNVTLSVLANNADAVADTSMKHGKTALKSLGEKLVGKITTTATLAPGEEKQMVFMLTWYFPNRPLQHAGGWDWGKAVYTTGPAVGNMYANWYSSSLDVAHWLQQNKEQLTMLTHRFHQCYYENANLPYWLIHRIMMPVSTLATETTQWWATNKFWAWEGVGACNGTCTHVWNYEQALAHLFPGLERNIRERTDFSTSLQNDGAVMTRDGEGGVRIDGHIGTILKTYREHLNSANNLFLSRNWENAKQVMRYAVGQDAKDGKIDGMIRNEQQNTYDVSFYGANTFVGGLYLAALKAAEKMALNMNEPVFADSCRMIFEAGSKYSSKQLWNGSYFIQQVDLQQHPHGQYSDGCFSDQLFGQTWAHMLDLGYIYPEDKVKQTLHAIWNNNWTKDVAAYNTLYSPDRLFARQGDAGLINCTWPRSKHPGNKSVPYRDEVWTGVEYQVATNMIYDGMVNEGLSIVKAIHERYSPEKHNPWNEIECGDHYTRALASWGVLLALEDYYYDGPDGFLSFAPKIQPNDFNGFFTAAKGWGNLVQRRSKNKQVNEVQVAFGELRLTKIQLQIDKGVDPGKIIMRMNDRSIPCTWKREDKILTISAIDEVLLENNQRLTIQINF